MNKINNINLFERLVVGIIGFLLVTFVENNIIAADIVISITFITNLALMSNSKVLPKNKIRYILASLIFGALFGVVFT